MTTIKTDFGEGAANIDSSNGSIPTMAETFRDIADDLETLADGIGGVDITEPASEVTVAADAVVTAVGDVAAADGAVDGLSTGSPTTPSTQITGTGDTTWNVDITAGTALLDAVTEDIAVAADFEIHGSSELLADGESAIARLVVRDNTGLEVLAVVGAAATTGTQEAPTDADIDTAVGSAVWFEIASCTLNRTGDTTVTQSQDLTGYQAYSATAVALAALANDLKAKYNASVTLPNDIKAKYNAAVALLNEIRTELIAFDGSVGTLKTIKG